ncbi:MAG: ABC transporter substrate-binding protein [Roseateles asaccharophilus]|uniref:ABC-type transport system substrate-binding protein n=1 Tax=Roseateles asaccharophilus TaxID=582607 RepID=A0A4R6NB26_9BURK|nr:ABC transporter substrate-binding protein [Roseateles asaccharophilus]MDN3543130.1 ABC transporter substrate-binding protein [Roseateles asaccharophilus]TDP13172.1 ABC-type transport system substrate-binding protein [Roseateles asaccharophilus]
MKILRRQLCTLAALGTLTALSLGPIRALAADAPPPAAKVLRYAFQVAETGFDPAQLSDIYSRTITAHIFEALYQYDHLARPVRLKPLTAAAMPEVSEDFRTWTIKLKPGIFFADDPAFGGKKRELVAEDYVYSFKRFADPAFKSPAWATMEDAGILGLKALREQALKSKQAFDYDSPIEGLRALDRHTLQIRVQQGRPHLLQALLTGSDLYGAVAREVIEAYPGKSMEHPVGTGPFVLKEWRRSSRMVLERNPSYRERFYDAEPAADDAEGQALLARFKGRRLPMLDRVEISVIEEAQPRWLSFLNGEKDYLERVPAEFISQALPNGQLAPGLARRGIQAQRIVGPESTMTVFNMEDPVVGGYTAEKVALRRAIGLAIDVDREIRLVRRGQAIPAQSPVVPHTTGYAPQFKSSMSDFDPARAKALLELYGYVDRDGDGWRELPDGSPLTLTRHTQPESASRQLDEILQKNLKAVGLRIEFKTAKWPENLKSVRGGKFQIWGVASSADKPDAQAALQRLYGPATGGQNLSRFKLPAFDRLYERMQTLPDGPERLALIEEAKRIAAVYLPYRNHVHRLITDVNQPWLIGYRRALFWQDWWQYVDVDPTLKAQP